MQHFDLGAVISSLLKTLPPPLPLPDSAGHVGCIDGRLLRFVFLTQKEPVHKSHLLMKSTTLGALHATIVHSLVKDAFFAIIFHYAVIAAAEK